MNEVAILLARATALVRYYLLRRQESAVAARGESRPGSHALRMSASYAIVHVDCSGAETSRLKELEIPP